MKRIVSVLLSVFIILSSFAALNAGALESAAPETKVSTLEKIKSIPARMVNISTNSLYTIHTEIVLSI